MTRKEILNVNIKVYQTHGNFYNFTLIDSDGIETKREEDAGIIEVFKTLRAVLTQSIVANIK